MQFDQGICCTQTESLDVVESFSWEQMLGWYFVHAQKHFFTWHGPVIVNTVNLQWNLCKKATFEIDFSGWCGKVAVL